MVCLAGMPDDPTYAASIKQMSATMLKISRETKWSKAEKQGNQRGKFPSANYGISFGKGQPEPMRLGGDRKDLMKEFISNTSVQRVAAYQSCE